MAPQFFGCDTSPAAGSRESSEGSGEIVAAGTPEDVVRAKLSYTGQFLARGAGAKRKKRVEAAE